MGPALTSDADDSANADNSNADYKQEEFRKRPPTQSGGRNLQDSSFSFSGWLQFINCFNTFFASLVTMHTLSAHSVNIHVRFQLARFSQLGSRHVCMALELRSP